MHFSSHIACVRLTPKCVLCGTHHANGNMGAAMLGGPGSIYAVRAVQIIARVFSNVPRQHLRGEHRGNGNSGALPRHGQRQSIWCTPCKRALAETALPCRDNLCGVDHSSEINVVDAVRLAQGPHLCGAHHLNEIYYVHTAQPRPPNRGCNSMRCTPFEIGLLGAHRAHLAHNRIPAGSGMPT